MNRTVQVIAVYTTVASVEDARRLARALVELKLAACAQISAIESCYVWQGAMQQEAEWRILFKTTSASYGAVEAAIRERHPYELPAIHAVAAAEVFEPYARWVAEGSLDGTAPERSA